MMPQKPPNTRFGASSIAPNPIAEGSTESLVLDALTSLSTAIPEVPPYTPMPVPQRVSSAVKDTPHSPRVSSTTRDSATYRLFPKEETDAPRDILREKVRRTNSTQNEILLPGFPGFEDDLLLPDRSASFRGRTKHMSRYGDLAKIGTTSV